MAEDNTSKEKVIIDFKTNADSAQADVNELNASIEQTTESTKKNKKVVDEEVVAYKSLKTQLREAVIEQQKLSAQYGATSDQAIKAAKNVANINDEIGFQKDLVKSYNPDEKFRNLTQTAGVAALALGGVKDGFTALGIESKSLDKIIGSAQAILGVTSAIGGLNDAYELLTATQKAKSAANLVEAGTAEVAATAETEATVATWSWNSALLANPIVAITAGIVAAVAIIYAYVKITGDAVKAEEKAKVASMQLTVAIDNQSRAFENNNKFIEASNSHKIALLRASGASEAQIYKESKALKDQETQLAQNYRAEAIRLEQRAYDLDKANSTEATQEALKKAKENLDKANKAVSDSFDERIKLQEEHEIAVTQAETDARNKRIEEARVARDKALEAQKEANKKALEEEKAFQKALRDAKFESDVQKLQDDRDNIQSQNDEISKAEEEATNKQLQKEKENNDFFAAEAEKAIQIDRYKADQKKQIQDSTFDVANQAIGLAKQLEGKNKAIQKATIVAESAVGIGKTVQNVVTGNAAALAQGIVQAGPIAGPGIAAPAIALNTVSGSLSIASNIAATAKALQALGGGSAPSTSAVPSPRTGVSAQPQTGFQASSENQIATSIGKSQQELPPIKTYVVGSEVTTQVNLDAKLVKENSFG